MTDAILEAVAAFFYFSGFLVWPLCALMWRKKGMRTSALRRVFFGQLACSLALAGLACSHVVKLEHGYYWFILFILLNLFFTLLALGAAAFDYARNESKTA